MPEITRDEWRRKLRRGYASVGDARRGVGADGVKRVLALDPETGATVLEPAQVVGAATKTSHVGAVVKQSGRERVACARCLGATSRRAAGG